jgi:hypothetical protein
MAINMKSAEKLRLPNPPVSSGHRASVPSATITPSHTASRKFSGGNLRTMQNSPAMLAMFASE